MNTDQLERLSWKTTYAMVLANNTKSVFTQLVGCGKDKFELLGRGYLYHLFITKLFLVSPVGHMGPDVTD